MKNIELISIEATAKIKDFVSDQSEESFYDEIGCCSDSSLKLFYIHIYKTESMKSLDFDVYLNRFSDDDDDSIYLTVEINNIVVAKIYDYNKYEITTENKKYIDFLNLEV